VLHDHPSEARVVLYSISQRSQYFINLSDFQLLTLKKNVVLRIKTGEEEG